MEVVMDSGLAGFARARNANQDLFRLAPELTSSMRAAASLQIDVNVLLAREAQRFLDAFLASHARLLVSAKGRAEEMLRHLVDPHEARLNRRRHAMGGGEIVGPDRTRQPVLHLIDLRQHVVLAAPFEDRENRAE